MKKYTDYFESLRRKVDEGLSSSLELIAGSPLKDDIAYVFSMGGKRIRPVVTIISAEAVGKYNDDVLHGAVAIEILHNFTLVHDDIMDNASTRRGKTTVHVNSGVNTGILVGDLMMALAYDCLEKCGGNSPRRGLQIFNEGVKQVCDGQALDENLSRGDGASMGRYLDMISKKTGALLKAAGSLGALLGGGTEEEITCLGTFGLNLGIAFQILDDLLDLEGDSERFGKPLGLDVIEKKKNFLFLKARELMDGGEFLAIERVYKKHSIAEDDVVTVREAYRNGGIFEVAKRDVAGYTHRALSSLSQIRESDGKSALIDLANSLVQRKF